MTHLLQKRPAALFILLLLFALTTALYWRGLSGPFLLDDPFGLQNLNSWREGKQSLWMVLFGNESLLMHRALAMASFALNMVIGGDSTFSFKLGNLLHHLAMAAFVYLLVKQMFLRDARQMSQATWLALLVTALWLLHPLNVSTVLYVIQRMAQIAALCCVIGLWLYMTVRSWMESGTLNRNVGALWIWIAIPLLTFFGIQGKQNAAVLPMLCLVVELAYFSSPRAMPVPLRWFYLLTVGLPIIGLIIGLLTRAEMLFMSYWAYDFDMDERLLSEARAMWVYIRDTFAPYPPAMGIYADDFAISRGWLSPPTTLLAILGLGAITALVFRLRIRMPSLFAGWFIFLVGHAVESSFIPLELYYEHRNYLPSIGLLICAVVVVRAALDSLACKGVKTHRIAGALTGGALLVFAFQTGGRVHVWQNLDTLLRSSIDAHPGSIHANYGLLNSLVLLKKYDAIDHHLDGMMQSPDTRVKAAALIYRMNVDCALRRSTSLDSLQTYMKLIPQRRIELTTSQALEALITIAERKAGGCGPVSFKVLGDELARLGDRSVAQPIESYTRYTAHHQAARMYLAAGDSYNAMRQGRLSWQPKAPPNYSATLIRALVLQGHIEEAEQVLNVAESRVSVHNHVDQEGIQMMHKLIEAKRRQSTTTPTSIQR